MKPTNLLIPLTLLTTTQAADCTDPDAAVFSVAARDMMWSIRDWLCTNAWWESTEAEPQGAWCDKGGGIISAYQGSWTIRGVGSQQECWVIDQCMWYDYANHNYNGGSWSLGETYVGGWSWAARGEACVNPVKRGLSGEGDIKGDGTKTLPGGRIVQVDSTFKLDVSGKEAVIVDKYEY
ncbi:hypothetical protein BJX99DRAFT_263492 [Aspergillus californicus]